MIKEKEYAEDTGQIEITFPVMVHVTNDQFHRLLDIVDEICKGYENRHPDRVMWSAGIGGKPLNIWDDDALDFDMSVLNIECAERENYDYQEQSQ